ncbi:binding partner of ACD11 1-like [Musa acuminata AAA Group]|uniref:binding partner of ACD11 1-like n=1 Tax=Musa acuminata AAA Group TaxID=214697 RepID=UPI0031DF1A1B
MYTNLEATQTFPGPNPLTKIILVSLSLSLSLCSLFADEFDLQIQENVSVKTVKISNISLSASQRDIQEFFCFSGDIDYVEMQRDSQGAETAMPLTGATIVDLSVNVTPVEKYKLPPEAYRHKLDRIRHLPMQQ